MCGEETVSTISAHGGSIAVLIAKTFKKEGSSHQLAEVRVEEWLILVVADAHSTSNFKLGCAQLLQICVANNL